MRNTGNPHGARAVKSILSSVPVGILAVLLAAVLAACPQPVQDDPGGQGGWLEIRLSGPEAGRALLSPEQSSFAANAYEIILFGPAGFFFSETIDAGTAVIGLQPSTYRAVVLAGIRKSSTTSTALLVGAGASAQDIVIISGQRTNAEIHLSPVSLSLDAPDEAEWSSTFTVTAAGSTGCPYVGMELFGTTTANRPRLRSITLWNGYGEFGTVSGTPDDWTAELEVVIASGTGSIDLQFIGAAVSLLDAGEFTGPLTDRTVYAWKWPNRAEAADDSVLLPVIETAVNAIPPATGLDLVIEWI